MADAAQIIRNFFRKHGSPVAANAPAFVKFGREYGVNPFEMAAIVMKETEGGLTGTGRPGQYNLTGVGGVGHMQSYPNYKASIADTARNLGSSRYRGKSLAEQTAMWVAGTPPTSSTAGYTRDVASFMRMMGANPGSTGAIRDSSGLTRIRPPKSPRLSSRNSNIGTGGGLGFLSGLIGSISGVPELGAALQALTGGAQRRVPGLPRVQHKGRPMASGGFNVPGNVVGFPVANRHAKDLGGVAAHRARALGNWQSDNAVDVGVPEGTPIIAVANGRIGKTDTRPLDGGQFSGGSAYLMTGKNQFWYKHLKKVLVRPGQRVRKGQIIGYSGEGNGVPHLHFASLHGDPQHLIGL